LPAARRLRNGGNPIDEHVTPVTGLRYFAAYLLNFWLTAVGKLKRQQMVFFNGFPFSIGTRRFAVLPITFAIEQVEHCFYFLPPF
jgi:hypothetical protein